MNHDGIANATCARIDAFSVGTPCGRRKNDHGKAYTNIESPRYKAGCTAYQDEGSSPDLGKLTPFQPESHLKHCLSETTETDSPNDQGILKSFLSKGSGKENLMRKAKGYQQCVKFLNVVEVWWRWISKAEGWLFIGLTAILTGCSAAWIEIVVRFLSDWKIGFCYGVFALNRDFCCGKSSAVDFSNNECIASDSLVVHTEHVTLPTWVSWNAYFSISHTFFAYCVDYFMYSVIAITFATLAAWVCNVYAVTAMGSGIPEVKVILSGLEISKFLSFGTGLIKCAGLCMAVSSGLALGKEGPLVHIACCWASLLSKFSTAYQSDNFKRMELLSASCAAGVAVAFGAPLSGVLFSLEEISTHFPSKTLWKSFFGAVIGALSVKWFDTGGTGGLALFGMDSVSLAGTWQIQELIPFALIGLLGGSIGALFIKINVYWVQKKLSIPSIALHPICEVMLVTAMTSLINYPFAMLRVSSGVLLQQLFSRCGASDNPDIFHFCTLPGDPNAEYSDYTLNAKTLLQLFFVCCIRFFETSITFGIGLPAGLFIPTLTVCFPTYSEISLYMSCGVVRIQYVAFSFTLLPVFSASSIVESLTEAVINMSIVLSFQTSHFINSLSKCLYQYS